MRWVASWHDQARWFPENQVTSDSTYVWRGAQGRTWHSQPLSRERPEDRVPGFPDHTGCFAHSSIMVTSQLHACARAEPSAGTVPDHHWFGLAKVCKPYLWVFCAPPPIESEESRTICVPPWPQDRFNKSGIQKRVGTATWSKDGDKLPGLALLDPSLVFLTLPESPPPAPSAGLPVYSP